MTRVWYEKDDPLQGPAVGDAPGPATLDDIDNALLCIRDELIGIREALETIAGSVAEK